MWILRAKDLTLFFDCFAGDVLSPVESVGVVVLHGSKIVGFVFLCEKVFNG